MISENATIYIDRRTGEQVLKQNLTRDMAGHLRVQVVNNDPSTVVDTELEFSDINHVIERFYRTGQLPEATKQPQYGDVTGYQGDLTERYAAATETQQIAQEYADQHHKEQQVKQNQDERSTDIVESQPQPKTDDTAASSDT